MAEKATHAEMIKRVATVLRLLVAGMPRADILQYASKTWKTSERSTDELIKRAKEEIAATVRPESEAIVKEAILRLDELYMKCYLDKKYRICLEIAREKCDRLLGRPAQAIAVSGAMKIKVVPAKFADNDEEDDDDDGGADEGVFG